MRSGGYYIIEDWSVGYMGGEYDGMNEVVTNIILKAPQLNIESLKVVDNKSTLAAFRG